MGVFSRLSDILNSNLNSILDKAEDPAKMVRLIIQEMEETLVEVRTTAARAIADKKELSRKAEYHVADSNDWDQKAEIAVRKGRDDLARAALAEKRRSESMVEQLEIEVQTIDDMLAKLNDDIETLTRKLADAKARQNAIVARGKTAKARLNVKRQLSEHNINDAMTRFEHYERRMDDLEGQVESYDIGQKTLSDEIDDLVDGEQVDEELQELKNRIKGKVE